MGCGFFHKTMMIIPTKRLQVTFLIIFRVPLVLGLLLKSASWRAATRSFVSRQVAAYEKNPSTPKPSNLHILILPGFGNDSGDYFLPRAPEGSLVRSLVNRGWNTEQVHVLPVKRIDWLQVFFRGCFDPQFWSATASPTRPAFAWYLSRISEAISDITKITNDCRVILVCHSAGGWLARAALGFGSSLYAGNRQSGPSIKVDLERVVGVVSLGAPHLPPPTSIMDMTRGALRITDEKFPGAFHSEQGIFYLTVVGAAIQGERQLRTSPFEPTSITGFAFNSYAAVCGNGTAVGDGVVPCVSAHLDGALQLTLEGVFHSINAPDQWYGSNVVIDRWHEIMTQLVETQNALTACR